MEWGLLLYVAAATACTSHRATQTTPAPAEQRTVLKVHNQAFLDMTIYVLNGAQRIRLGIAGGNEINVQPGDEVTLTIPS